LEWLHWRFVQAWRGDQKFFAATYAQPGGMRAGFAQFTAFSQDAKDNEVFERVKLTMPVLAVGGEKSFGPLQAVIMRHVATNVQEAVVAGSGHWLMEERPAYTVTLIRNFLDSPQVARCQCWRAQDISPKHPRTGTEWLWCGECGAAGTFVVRKPGSRAKFRSALLRKLPFEAELVLCDGRDLIRLEAENPFAAEPSSPDVVRFVSILSKPGRLTA
jgi:hypothetical protein